MGGKGSGLHSHGGVPSPTAGRRDRANDAPFLKLPRSGRKGKAPEWPLTLPEDRELEHWDREWSRPQAIMWERNGQEVEVAIYVRQLAKVEEGGSSQALTVLRQFMVQLGITLTGLHQNRWMIVDDSGEEVEPDLPAAVNASSSGNSARSRFPQVVSLDDRR